MELIGLTFIFFIVVGLTIGALDNYKEFKEELRKEIDNDFKES